MSRCIVSLIMCTGGAYRPFLHQRHFRAACSFKIAVVRAPLAYLRQSIQGWPPCQACGRRDLTQPSRRARPNAQLLSPEHESNRARRAFESHLSRAKWMTEHGYPLLLRGGASA